MGDRIWVLLLAGVLLAGCGSTCTKTEAGSGGAAARAAAAETAYYQIRNPHNNRIYITKSDAVAGKLQKAIREGVKEMPMPYTRTFIGAGPQGETLVFEVDKKDPEYTRDLIRAYYSGVTDFYKEVFRHGRVYVTGQIDTYLLLDSGAEMPYTRTLIGEGPNGETLVFEVDKKDPALVERLMAMYYQKHPLYKEVERHKRIYICGTREIHKTLMSGAEMPYTRTLIGEGPNGETLVFEVDKKDPALVERLMAMYYQKHPLYKEVERHNRIYVCGTRKIYMTMMSGAEMPYTRTLIGAGPGGKTVVFEIDKKDASVLERLMATFAKRHNVKL